MSPPSASDAAGAASAGREARQRPFLAAALVCLAALLLGEPDLVSLLPVSVSGACWLARPWSGGLFLIFLALNLG